jgi:hypothetical protein
MRITQTCVTRSHFQYTERIVVTAAVISHHDPFGMVLGLSRDGLNTQGLGLYGTATAG